MSIVDAAPAAGDEVLFIAKKTRSYLDPVDALYASGAEIDRLREWSAEGKLVVGSLMLPLKLDS